MADRRWPALDLRFSPGPGAGALQDFLYAELDAFEPVAIQEHESGDGWRVFFRTRAQRNAARAALSAEFRNALLDLSAVDVADEDWARRSQAALTAIQVGRIVVAPPWDVPTIHSAPASERHATDTWIRTPSPQTQTPNAGIVIVIEPSMGFGTGHHETTRLCLALLQELEVAGRRVIDVGTGSGVLAIAAAKLGAAAVLAIDNDADALANARENVARNAADAVELCDADASSIDVAPADVVLANLTGATLRRAAAALGRLVGPNGSLIASGFAADELADVAAALRLDVRDARQEGPWAAATLGRRRDTASL